MILLLIVQLIPLTLSTTDLSLVPQSLNLKLRIRYRKRMRHYNAMPGSILILDPEPDQYLTVKGNISVTDLLNLANAINNDTLQLLQATPKSFLEKTWEKFVHYFPLSLIICLLPIILVIAASSVKIPKKKKND
jgi:hypothetical protein